MPIGQRLLFRPPGGVRAATRARRGMVQCDIKPANLMLSRHKNRPVIKVLDFGLSKAVSEQNGSELTIGMLPPSLLMDFGEHLTSTGRNVRHPRFRAP